MCSFQPKERMYRCCGYVYSTNTCSHTQIQASIVKYLNTLQICVSVRYLSVKYCVQTSPAALFTEFYNVTRGQPQQPVVQQDCSTTSLGCPRHLLLFHVSQHYLLWLESLSQLTKGVMMTSRVRGVTGSQLTPHPRPHRPFWS